MHLILIWNITLVAVSPEQVHARADSWGRTWDRQSHARFRLFLAASKARPRWCGAHFMRSLCCVVPVLVAAGIRDSSRWMKLDQNGRETRSTHLHALRSSVIIFQDDLQ